ncbi:Mannan endo-1,4-beta-mannosidase man26A [Arachnomyces sp. PD_36]|nr:Mannan endo-1,4-beta-mannosidase man26A [Arachnomyces sp. PD_36]
MHLSHGLVPVLAVLAGAQNVTLEAEDAALNGVVVETELKGFTGTGYVNGFNETTDKVTFNLNSTSQTLYDVSLRYAGIYGEKTTTVSFNGESSNNVVLPETEEFTSISGGQVLLNEGANVIEIQSNWGWYLIDSISLSPSPPRGPHNISPAPVNAKANADALALYDYLSSVYGENVLSGQQEVSMVKWLEENVGAAPAILGVDLMDYSPSRVERGTNGTSVEEAIAFSERGGIIAMCWHWNAPVGLYDTEEQPWYSGFYTEATDFNITTALADTTNANYTLLIRDIDAIAVQLERLQDANVPVLFRPLHEAEGGWFWWGAQGPEPCKKLWDIVYTRLTEHHGLNNLIWTWNSLAADWYPGDKTVDILSTDVYANDHGPLAGEYNQLLELGGDQKMLAASEVGRVPSVDLQLAYQTDWLYFCTWSDGYINNEKENPLEFLEDVFADDYVLTLEDVQGWRETPARRW